MKMQQTLTQRILTGSGVADSPDSIAHRGPEFRLIYHPDPDPDPDRDRDPLGDPDRYGERLADGFALLGSDE